MRTLKMIIAYFLVMVALGAYLYFLFKSQPGPMQWWG